MYDVNQTVLDDVAVVDPLLERWLVNIDSLMTQFTQQCVSERRELRKRITMTSEGRQEFSHIVLLYRLHMGYPNLYWAELVYRRGKKEPLARRLKGNANGVHVNAICRGAHPEERELLVAHEHKARAMRKMWEDFVIARRYLSKVAMVAGMLASAG